MIGLQIMYENFLLLTFPAAILLSVWAACGTFLLLKVTHVLLFYRQERKKDTYREENARLITDYHELFRKYDDLNTLHIRNEGMCSGLRSSAEIAKQRVSNITSLGQADNARKKEQAEKDSIRKQIQAIQEEAQKEAACQDFFPEPHKTD